jgi:hypothetical protein
MAGRRKSYLEPGESKQDKGLTVRVNDEFNNLVKSLMK